MPRFHRVSCAMLLLAFLPAMGASQSAPQDLSGDPRILWLQKNAQSIRSIDPADEDFRDLKPLRASLKGVRLVLLGEADHRSGSDFLAKSRLVKFLHRELGFDVLAFEAPMFDMTVAWDRLRSGTPPGEALLLGASTWAGAEQMRPLVEYLGDEARGRRPLEIAGFDHQHQMASLFQYADDLTAFLKERNLGGPLVDPESPESAVLRGLSQVLYQYGITPRPDVPTRRAFLAAVETSLMAVRAMRDERARQWAQLLRSLSCHARFVMGNPEIGTCNRDEQMAENLLWLANERHPDRKIIVWSHTGHAARLAKMPPEYGGGPSMGYRIGQSLGPKSYAIGVTSYSGNRIVADQNPLPEFEELMSAARFQYGFLDLRRAAAGRHWAGGEFLARPIDNTTRSEVWSDKLDALLFVRERIASQDTPPPAADLQAIKDVGAREKTAFRSRDADSYVALFTDDCVVITPNGSRLRGRAAVRALLDTIPEQFVLSGGHSESDALIKVGDWAWELHAVSTAESKPGSEAAPRRYRGMHIYRRQPDGSWRIAQDVWNATMPRGGTW